MTTEADLAGYHSRVRFHFVRMLPGSNSPSSVLIVELANAHWEAPEDWPAQISEILASRPDNRGVQLSWNNDKEGVLDIVARTGPAGAQGVIDQHRVASKLEEWTNQQSHSPSSRRISSAEAEDAAVFALEFHFETSRDDIDTLDVQEEPGGESQIRVGAGPRQFVGTVRRQRTMQFVLLVNNSGR